MQIGPYTLNNNLIVAPMAGVTDRPFRQLCKRLGAGMAVSEMMASDARLRGTRKSVQRSDHAGEVEPISVQIAGADPRMMADAARWNVDRGAQIIDINMGCPAKKVCNVLAGSALLRDEPLVGRILDAVVGAVDVPVTLKIRTGWDPVSRNAERVARIAQSAGVRALTVHGRTRACGFSGQAEYHTIRSVKRTVNLPVIANGDIDSPQKARSVLEATGADALMIGRAAQGRPWLFREIHHYLQTGRVLAPPGADEMHRVLRAHLLDVHQFYGEERGVRVARKHIGWYTHALPGALDFRSAMNAAVTAAGQLAVVDRFFAGLAGLDSRPEDSRETLAA
jgi:tRNA-dihydrouridine synthase B